MATPAKVNGIPAKETQATLELPPNWDHWLGQILPVAIPKAEEAVGNLIQQKVAEFSGRHPGKTFWQVFGEAIAAKLEDQDLRKEIFDRLHLTGFIAKVSNFSHELLDLIQNDPNLASLKDAAQKLDTKALAAQLADGAIATAQTVRKELFDADPTATIAGIVQVDKVTVPNSDPVIKDHTLSVLSNMGPTDLAMKSPHILLHQRPSLLAKIPAEHRPAVVENINTLARTQTISRSPPAFEAMMNNGLTSAVAVANTPISNLKTIMGHDDAIFAKTTANHVVLRNQLLLASLMNHVKTQAPGSVGPSDDRDASKLRIREAFRARGLNPTLEDIFGSADQPVADENTTVYSPASYFVDLLMYLRNNNLDSNNLVPNVSTSGEDDKYQGTALASLFRRRPDLQNLELSAANTTTQIPYVDLVNEVLESFIIHLPDYLDNAGRQAVIDTFNVTTQDTDDLLSQPQNINMDAYRHLAGAVYPPTLPYHQPIDAQRTFLSYLGTTRAELVNTFRPKPSLKTLDALPTPAAASGNGTLLMSGARSEDPKTVMKRLQGRALDAQYCCEVLGLVQEEFLVLTKGVFWEKDFFELAGGLAPLDVDQYQRRVGLRSTIQCWGYATAEEMFSTDMDPGTGRRGLSFIKQQLLPRSGLSYTNLIDIVSTSFVNPFQPTGVAKLVFDSLRYSYRFLQELVDESGASRYDRMAQFVVSHTSELNLLALFERSKLKDLPSASRDATIEEELKAWITRNFKRMGKILVIDAGQGARLKVDGRIVAKNSAAAKLPLLQTGMAELASDGRILQGPTTELSQAAIATLLDDGTIIDANGGRMGQVGLNSRVYYKNPLNDNDFNSFFPKLKFFIESQPSWIISGGKLSNTATSTDDKQDFNKIWELDESMGGSGDIENARLLHLDGSPLSLEEWDRLHRFVRLWRKLGWNVAETDRAMCSLVTTPGGAAQSNPSPTQPSQANGVDWDHDSRPFDYEQPVNFEDFEADSSSVSTENANSRSSVPDITYPLIEQLAAVKMVLSMASLSLEELLTFFCPMTSRGPKSQYTRLFMSRQLRVQASAFTPDLSGLYFTNAQGATIRQQISTISAALGMKQGDIIFLTTVQTDFPGDWTVPDVLTMDNLSRLYRHALLARTLSVKVTDLFQIMGGFGNPFSSPKAFLNLLKDWRKMTDAGIPWQELRYVVDQIPTPADPLALTEYDSLRVSKTLRENMVDIQTTYPLDVPLEKRTSEYIRTVTSLICPASVVTSIVGLLGGSTLYSAPCPVISDPGFSVMVSTCSNSTVNYLVPPQKGDLNAKSIIQVTGIIDAATRNRLKVLVKSAKLGTSDGTLAEVQRAWEKSIDQICEKPFQSFRGLMDGILPKRTIEDEISGNDQILLAPDPIQAVGTSTVIEPNEHDRSNPASHGQLPSHLTQAPTDASTSDSGAVPATSTGVKVNPKVARFLRYFLPFLQAKLTYNSVLDAVSTATGFSDSAIARTYLENVITVPVQSSPAAAERALSSEVPIAKQSAISYIIKHLSDSLTVWQGYLSFDVPGDYIFSIQGSVEAPEPFGLQPVGSEAEEDLTSSALGSSGLFDVPLLHGAKSGMVRTKLITFRSSPGGPHGLWVTDAVTVVAGDRYWISINNIERSKLRWQTASIEACRIPGNRYVPVWKGYLRPNTTDAYKFYAKDLGLPAGQEMPTGTLVIDSMPRTWEAAIDSADDTFYPLSNESHDPRLDASKLHRLELTGIFTDQLCWKTQTTALESIPSSCFLPASTPNEIYGILTKLQKLALFSNHFKLSSEEILYIHQNAQAFTELPGVEAQPDTEVPSIDLDGIHALRGCTRLYDYTKLRDGLPQNTSWSLIELFSWASQHKSASGADLAQKINYATSWPKDQVLLLLENSNFSTGASGSALEFRNERLLIRLQAQLDMSRAMGVSPDVLFIWASPLGTAPRDFNAYNTVSRAIQQQARSRFSPTDWTTAVRPLNNLLRENQRAALVSYLLVQQRFVRENNIVDADSLFEFFLIDVQMKPLVETSRIIQAIATIQLFVQRCMLGLEEPVTLTKALDRQRWSWMQNFRVWQANRQIFLYPENWLVPSLRDDKSDIFKTFESELLQNNLSRDATSAALRNFVFNLANLASLEAVGLHAEKQGAGDLHVFARTRTSPFSFYYNRYRLLKDQAGQWDGWQDMKIQIPAVIDPNTNNGGVYFAPIVFDGRLIVFVPEITQQTFAKSFGNKSFQAVGGLPIQDAASQTFWEFKMSWTEYRNGTWTPRQTCPQPYQDDPNIQDVSIYLLVPCLIWKKGEEGTNLDQATPPSSVAIHLTTTMDTSKVLAGWTFDGRQVSIMDKDLVQSLIFRARKNGDWKFQVAQPAPAPVPDVLLGPVAERPSPGPARIFSLQGSNKNPAGLSNIPDTTIWLDGATQSVEDAESYDQYLSIANAKTTVIDPHGPTIMPLAIPSPESTSKSVDSTQRFYHGSIHQLVRSATNSGDVSSLFAVLGAIGAGPSSQPTEDNVKDFCEAFGAFSAAKDAVQSVPRPETKSGAAIPDQANGTASVVNNDAAPVTAKARVPIADGPATTKSAKAAGSRDLFKFDQRSRLYSLYNWELGMHACMSLMDSLLKAQQFEQARDVCHYIFDPFASGDKNDPSRFWRFPPFKVASVATIESLFLEVEAGKSNISINDWRNHPFQPHVIARSRPEAYMKWIVVTYIKILIGWGDSLFSLNTLESIPQAIQLYVMASHIYGPRGQVIPRRTDVVPQTFRTLSKKFDAFSNAMVQLEETFPFSNQTPLPDGKLTMDVDDHLPNIFGFAGTLYFAIPDNPSIRQLAATIDDRLFKIRNSEDINGTFRVLPLLAPPIDPALLVQAQAQGLSLSSVLQDLQGPLPNCRFELLLQNALEVVAEVRSLGQSLISIRERHDAENLSLMRQRQELSLQKALMGIKTMSLQDAENSIEVLRYNRAAAVSRLGYWFKTVGTDLSGIPALNQEYQELDAKIAAPITDGGLGLSALEKENIDKTSKAQDITTAVNALEIHIAWQQLCPDVTLNGQPFGMGESVSLGARQLTAAESAASRGLSLSGQLLQSQAGLAGTMGAHQRALQERILQANSAGYEISNIDKQITGAQIRATLAQREIDIQQQQIDDTQATTDYLASKYSSADLYTWMDGMTKTLSYQTYSAAFALAERVEKAFKYERPQNAEMTYIQAGYWDGTKDGLFAGESLYLSLKQLEAAYLDTRGHDYEITKSVSLRTLDPVKLIQLREQGSCEFSIDEILFDMDFPGHYLRRLKSVTLTIPCVVGPQVSVNATLRLLSSEYRTTPSLAASYAKDLTSSTSGVDPRFTLATPPLSAIAVSSASADTGVFTLDFSAGSTAPRYMPFEGAGAISKWRLSLPTTVRQFNYDSIFDVVLQLRYTALDGGEPLRAAADTAVKAYLGRLEDYAAAMGFVAVLDLKNEWAGEWARAVGSADVPAAGSVNGSGSVVLNLGDVRPRLPFFTFGKSVNVVRLHLLVDQALDSGSVTVNVGPSGGGKAQPDPVQLKEALKDVSPLQHYVSESGGAAVPFGDRWAVQLGERDKVKGVTKCVLLLEYVLAGTG